MSTFTLEQAQQRTDTEPRKTISLEEAQSRFPYNAVNSGEISIPEPTKTPIFEKIGKGFGTGVTGMVEGIGGVAKWFGIDTIGDSINSYAKEMKEFYDVPDPDFVSSVSAGFGSMATFLIPGLGVSRGVKAVSAIPRLAAWLGVSASSVMEASVEAGGAYNKSIAKGVNHKEASSSATKDFWLNLPVLVFTNKFGIFGENGTAILKGIKSSASEAIQEFTQQLIGNFSTKDPLMEGALESAAVGAIVGGGTGAILGAVEGKSFEGTKAKEFLQEEQEEEKLVQERTEEKIEIPKLKGTTDIEAVITQSPLTSAYEKAKATLPTGPSVPSETEAQVKSIGPSEEIALPMSPQSQIVKTNVAVPSPESMQQERGFVKSVKESPMVGKETKEEISALPEEITSYDVYTDKAAVEKAKQRVDENAEESLAYVLTSQSLDKDVTTTGIELMRRYREQGNVEQEVNVAASLAEKGTKGGQFIQAYSILDKLSPDGVLVFAQREINRGIEDPSKRKIIDPELADKLKNQAGIIQETPYGYQKVKEINKLMEMISKKKGKSIKDWTTDLINVPRTLMSSMLDFSFGFRQGLFLLPSFPQEWSGAFSKQFGAFANEENYDALMDSIMKHPDYALAENSGIAFTDIRGDFGKLEEQYMGSNLAEKIPVVGGIVRATNRAYVAMGNKMRMDIFSKMVKDMENIGLDPRSNKRLLQEVATFVNAGTGRGGLGGILKQSAPLLNGVFYSPRLMSSRLTLLNPQYYITRQPGLRKQALKSLFSFFGLWATVLGLAKMMGAEIGIDPRSADLGKIKIGNTRIDFGGGFAQWIRMAGQLVTGEYVSSTTGRKLTLGEGYKPLTRYDILIRQLESKEAPVVSFITDLLRQQDYAGKKVDIPKEIMSRFTPMIMQDIYDLVQEDPELLPLGILPVFGVGLQTYGGRKKHGWSKKEKEP